MRKIILLAAMLIISRFSFAQSYEGTVDYQKNKQATAVLELPYPPGVVEDAIKDKMKRMGYSGKESKGFIVFKGVRDSTGKEMDYLLRVERKSRKEKDESVVYLFGQGANIDMAKTGEGSDIDYLKTQLNKMQPDIEAYHLEVQIADQEETVKKAEKKYDNLQDDQKSLEKKLKKLQDDIADNKKDQENQQKEIENQKKVLETLKAKRKG
ncbi:MAG: hypothetical protein HYX40_02225 [Sphingobacteriales bacterium]|nr:hypothetical protein [Sphingobacteriales bacterium]